MANATIPRKTGGKPAGARAPDRGVFFAELRSLHNGVENSVENVQNPWGGDFQAGDGLVMGNFTQQHFCEISVKREKREEAGGFLAAP